MFRRGRTTLGAGQNNNNAEEIPSFTQWDTIPDISSHLQKCVPQLTSQCHKGSSGRVGVLGGSARYTGAPFYAAMAALRTGADLAFCFCAAEAALPIKCYSPELMVSPVYKAEEFDSLVQEKEQLRRRKEAGVEEEEEKEDIGKRITEIEKKETDLIDAMVSSVTESFDRLHVLIVGPGLGRCPLVLRAAAKIIVAAKEHKLPMVIDADGLYLLGLKENSEIIAGYKGLVLTPNAVEVKRLTRGLGVEEESFKVEEDTAGSPATSPVSQRKAWTDSPESRCNEMSSFERATEDVLIVKKGKVDICFLTSLESSLRVNRISMLCEEKGGLKRSGGIGDILSGCIGTFVAWNLILGGDSADLMLGCWSACCITKRATKYAFKRKKRGMTAPDVLEDLSRTVDEMTQLSIVDEDN